jgi:hypothetical protein
LMCFAMGRFSSDVAAHQINGDWSDSRGDMWKHTGCVKIQTDPTRSF